MSTITSPADRTILARSDPRRRPWLSVALAVLAAVSVWILAVRVLGFDLLIRFGNSAPQTVGIAVVFGASLVGSLAGWGLLAMLESRVANARRLWTILATSFLLISLSLPLIAGTTTSTKASLALMHIAVAGVLIPALRRG